MSISSWPSSSVMPMPLRGVVLHDEQPLRRGLGEVPEPGQGRLRGPRVVVGLLMNEKAPRASPCWRSSSRVTICTGMCRVAGSCFSWLSTCPAEHVGQENVERDRGRAVVAREHQRVRAAHSDEDLETLIVGEVGHHARVVRIVLDDQQDRIVGFDPVPVVGQLIRGRLCEPRRRADARRRPRPPRTARSEYRRRRYT